MKQVTPQVFLVARPVIDTDGMQAYLQEVDGLDWFDRSIEDNMNGDLNDAEMIVEFGGKLCYRAWKPGLNANVSRVREDHGEYLGNILTQGHGSVTEHANFSFVLHNVSRVLTHELVRHRPGAAYSQESMRYVRLDDIPFWFPQWAQSDTALMERSVDLLLRMEHHQRWMAEHFGLDDETIPFSEKKHKTSFMRRFSPQGVATGILATYNIRALRHIIHMRTNLGAEEEIRLVCGEIASICAREFPHLMQDYSPNEHREWIPDFLKV